MEWFLRLRRPMQRKEHFPMSMNQHVTSLSAKHAQLENRITRETVRPAPDWQLVHQLKKEKLRLKDTLERIAQ